VTRLPSQPPLPRFRRPDRVSSRAIQLLQCSLILYSRSLRPRQAYTHSARHFWRISDDTSRQMVCFNCGESVIEYDIAAGNGYCTSCGTVVEENTIVNEISFGETSTGAAMVQGSYVAQGASPLKVSHPRLSFRYSQRTRSAC